LSFFKRSFFGRLITFISLPHKDLTSISSTSVETSGEEEEGEREEREEELEEITSDFKEVK